MKAARLDAFRNVSPNGNAHNLSRPFRSIPVAGSKSMLSLYRPDIATMEIGESGAEWSVGVLEYWSDGEVESWIGLLRDSVTSRLHYSMTPLLR